MAPKGQLGQPVLKRKVNLKMDELPWLGYVMVLPYKGYIGMCDLEECFFSRFGQK